MQTDTFGLPILYRVESRRAYGSKPPVSRKHWCRAKPARAYQDPKLGANWSAHEVYTSEEVAQEVAKHQPRGYTARVRAITPTDRGYVNELYVLGLTSFNDEAQLRQALRLMALAQYLKKAPGLPDPVILEEALMALAVQGES